jgi:putative two-component system response regulator
MTNASILIVDGVESRRQTLKTALRNHVSQILESCGATEALEILGREVVDLVIVESSLPGMTGLELCRWLKVNPDTQLIPVLVLASDLGPDLKLAAISSGADEFHARPLNPIVFGASVAALLRQKHVTDSLENAEAILFTLALAVEQRDRFTGEHCRRMAVYSVALGRASGVAPPGLLALYRAGYLHDIGKISIPDSVLFKKRSLNPQEWGMMHQHTLKGEEICRPMKSLASVLPIIRSHHERWDGSGYPDGLKQDGIPLLARILQICDIYDALTSERSYKVALSPAEAIAILKEEVKRGWRDPEVFARFQEVSRKAMPGIMVPAAFEFAGMLSMHHAITEPAWGNSTTKSAAQ